MFVLTTSSSQELKKKTKFANGFQEEYTVLKNNKELKHGQYIRFRIGLFGEKAIDIIGSYNAGERTGEWLYFTQQGYLEHEGNYLNDQKSGRWIEYYKTIPEFENTLNAINSAFSVNKGIAVSKTGELFVDRSVLIKSSEGHYHKGKKVGIWNYYETHGKSVHNFDHDSMQVLQEFDADGVAFPFLGGRSRFIRKFGSVSIESTSTSKIVKFIIRRGETGVAYGIDQSEDKTVKDIISNLKDLEDELLWEEGDSLSFSLEILPNDGGLFGNCKIDLEYVKQITPVRPDH